MTEQDPTQGYELPSVPPVAAEPPLPPGSVPTTRLTPAAPAGRPGRSRLRWLVAGVVTLLIAGTAIGATALLTRDSGDPAVLAWTPADSVAYAEARLDLPGSQAAELARVMKAFPGFEDQAAFPVKLSEALDQLVGKASDGKMSYATDIEPWFGGQVGASVGPLPRTADAASARALLVVGIKDAAKASAWVDGLVKTEGGTTAADTYNGVTITTVSPPADAGAKTKDMKGAYAVDGQVLLIGDLASVKAGIDTGGSKGLSAKAQFKEAEATITGDRLGFVYVDTAAIVAGAKDLAGAAASAMPALPAALSDWTTPWAVAAIRAQDGAFVIDTRTPHVTAAGPARNAESKIPSLVPSSTVLLAEGHDVGESLARIKAMLASDPDLADAVKQVDGALALVGGFDAATGWIGEAGVAITRDGDTLGGGLVITPSDAAAAQRLMAQLKAFVQLGGAQSGLTVKEVPYAGTTITVVDLGGLGGMLGGMTGGAVPTIDGLSISYAVTDDVVVLGYGTDFVKGVLDARSGNSLATSERFSSALKQAGSSHASLLWVDVAGIRDFVEAQVPSADRADYDANVKPYLRAFDTVIGTMSPGDTIDSGTMVIHLSGN